MQDLQNREDVIRHIGGYMISNAIRAAGQHRVFATLADGALDPGDLARRVGVPEANLTRLLRLLLADLMVQREDGSVDLTDTGRLLVPGAAGSLAAFAQNFTSPAFQRAWDHTEQSVLDGEPGFEAVHGQPVYDYLGSHADENAVFNLAMREEATATAQAATRVITLQEGETVVDLGGGDGTFLTELLSANPTARGIVFDSEAGAAQAQGTIDERGLGDRCQVVTGDFFRAIPGDGTTYVIKSVLQDWDDSDVVRILSTCASQMPSGSRLIVIGNILPDRHEDGAAVAYLTDVCMLVISGGRERTETELRGLMDKAGFAAAVVALSPVGPLSTVEARPSA